MRFSVRLILFFAVTLVAIQGATILTTQAVLRRSAIADGQTQIVAAQARFFRQLAELQDRLAEGVRLLTLDFALRQAIADGDSATVVSALRNHGHRVGASRMMLIAADGTVEGDTATNKTHPFPYPAMLDRAAEEERFGSVAIMDGRPVWLVVVPVMAPDLIAFVAAALPLDDAELRRIHEVAGVPGRIGIAVQAPQAWKRAAGAINAAVVANLPGDGEPRAFTGSDGNEALAISRPLATPPGDAAVRVILDYPLSEALRQYQFLSLALLPVLGVGLLATLAGVTLIARGVSRPIELLARQTQRIAAGDYGVQPTLPRRDELGQLSVALGTMTSAIAEREQRILFQATHDSITGLANRTAIAAAIDVRLATGPATLLAVGLIRWREITSTVGRDVGDRLLREAAARIVAYMTGGQGAATVARIGENTFAVLLPGDDPAAASAAALRLIDAFDQPYREAELTIDTPVAVGVASAAAGDTDAAQLPRHAEIALAEAVRTETRFAVYRHDSDPYRPERLSLMGEMRAGLTRGEFWLAYQPQLDLRLGKITGAEALIRWNHPTRGPVAPDDFIGLAEETGNIQQLTRWALRAGLTEAKNWQDRGIPIRISVNVSVHDLTDESLPDRIAKLLREKKLSARSLVLEITESAIMREPEAAIEVLRKLDEMGIDLIIDDFGVGQSSLAYLRRLPVREIKFDKSFILNLPKSNNNRSIVRSVIELGHNLAFRVTAEGVEDLETLLILHEFGCDKAQGYFIGKPLPSDALLRLADGWRNPSVIQPRPVVP